MQALLAKLGSWVANFILTWGVAKLQTAFFALLERFKQKKIDSDNIEEYQESTDGDKDERRKRAKDLLNGSSSK